MADLYIMIGDSENRTKYAQRIQSVNDCAYITEDTESKVNLIVASLTRNYDVIYDAPNMKSSDRHKIVKEVSKLMIIPYNTVAIICDNSAGEKVLKNEGFDIVWNYDGTKWEKIYG